MRYWYAIMVGLIFSVAAAADFRMSAPQPATHEVTVSAFQRYARLRNERTTHHYDGSAIGLAYTHRKYCWEIGASIAFENGKRKYNHGMTWNSFTGGERQHVIRKTDNTLTGTVFGVYNFQYGWYLAGSASVAFEHLNNDTLHLVGESRSYRDDFTHVAASLEVGKNIEIPNGFALRPHLGVDVSFSEHQSISSNQPIRSEMRGSFQGLVNIPIGVEVRTSFRAGSWLVTPKLDVAAVITEANKSKFYEGFRPGFAVYTNRGWKVHGQGNDHVGVAVSAGLTARLRDRVTLSAEYDYAYRKRYYDHRLSATFALAF